MVSTNLWKTSLVKLSLGDPTKTSRRARGIATGRDSWVDLKSFGRWSLLVKRKLSKFWWTSEILNLSRQSNSFLLGVWKTSSSTDESVISKTAPPLSLVWGHQTPRMWAKRTRCAASAVSRRPTRWSPSRSCRATRWWARSQSWLDPKWMLCWVQECSGRFHACGPCAPSWNNVPKSVQKSLGKCHGWNWWQRHYNCCSSWKTPGRDMAGGFPLWPKPFCRPFNLKSAKHNVVLLLLHTFWQVSQLAWTKIA